MNSHNRPRNVLGSTIPYPHKPSISIVRLTTTNKDEFELINTIIHETIHVITLQYLHDNPRTAALLDEYAKYLRFKEGLEEGGWYGNKNAKEMIAEFFSNAEYREWLKTVPAPKLKMSMFEKIADFIARIFTGKSKTAYE
nr:MAG TPA: PPEP-2, Metalloprotease, Zinc, HYDROLASE [Caudoviricetes sp.]